MWEGKETESCSGQCLYFQNYTHPWECIDTGEVGSSMIVVWESPKDKDSTASMVTVGFLGLLLLLLETRAVDAFLEGIYGQQQQL